MKKSILTLAVVIIAVATFGNTNKFEKLMKQNLEIVRVSSDKTDYQNLGDEFGKIASHNKDHFEPLYYSAYCYIISSWQMSDIADKSIVLSKAKSQIDKALKISPNNDELLVLEAFYYQAMIMTNPQKYGQSFSAKASELLQKAQSINNKNPRAEFLLAQNIYYRPAEYGGGKKVALPLFEKAEKLFSMQNTNNYLLPIWGEATNAEMTTQCRK
jgi:tetratricopeptide (TPR) repeat protein